MNQQLDQALLAIADAEVSVLNSAPDQPVRVHDQQTGKAPPSLVRLDRLVQIALRDGTVIAKSQNLGDADLPLTSDILQQTADNETALLTINNFGDEPLRMIAVPVRTAGKHYIVQVAGSLDDTVRIADYATGLFSVLAIVLVAAVVFVANNMTKKVFMAIENIASQADRIGDANLSERLAQSSDADEIAHLTSTLNQMLERLENAFLIERRFTADASHEMRSPLTRLRAEIDICLRRERSPEDYRNTLHSCLEEVSGITSMVEELLLLARIESGQEDDTDSLCHTHRLLDAVVSANRSTAEAKNIQLTVDNMHFADIRLSERAGKLILNNLLENAIKFSDNGGTIRLHAATEGGHLLINVEDRGPGIAEQDLPHIFERFYRGQRAKSNGIPGSGLGLSLANHIATRAGASISVSNTETGARFTLHVPLV
ncbi:sensor histidine kinase [Undibacterium rugosum]|uniref:histidine kinase n=1 Tax=Undibacterium rugosum TaxID=2762291 RepID=A0A923I3S2_9BURK|nr:ATP-binding protein [Undibacterium rugosum]MBC3937214.1 HAMP domain-containing protein [Undibacterium rugosum]MBR7780402.1 HAMP domain-containing protein [Undibacterium rugosum]